MTFSQGCDELHARHIGECEADDDRIDSSGRDKGQPLRAGMGLKRFYRLDLTRL